MNFQCDNLNPVPYLPLLGWRFRCLQIVSYRDSFRFLLRRSLWAFVVWFGLLSAQAYSQRNVNEEALAEDIVEDVEMANDFLGVQAVPVNGNRGDWVESWIFGGVTTEAAKKRLYSQIEQRLDRINKQCSLTAEQKASIELAIQGDMERFFRRVQVLRKEMEGKQPNNANLREFAEILSPLQLEWSEGVFRPKSLFAKTLVSQLTPEQKASILGKGRREQEIRHIAKCKQFIVTIESSIPFNDAQRKHVLTLLESKMPKLMGNRAIEAYGPIYAASKIERSEVESMLSDEQIATFEQLQKHWRANFGFVNSNEHAAPNPTQEVLDALR